MALLIFSATSMPLVTRPKTVCLLSSQDWVVEGQGRGREGWGNGRGRGGVGQGEGREGS